jgi:hypothetical protein
MRNIIEAKIKETEQDYNLMGLYSNDYYAGRIMAFKELLFMLDKEDDEAMIGMMEMAKEEQEMIDARQAEEAQLQPLWSSKDGNIERQFLEAQLDEMYEDFEDGQY